MNKKQFIKISIYSLLPMVIGMVIQGIMVWSAGETNNDMMAWSSLALRIWSIICPIYWLVLGYGISHEYNKGLFPYMAGLTNPMIILGLSGLTWTLGKLPFTNFLGPFIQGHILGVYKHVNWTMIYFVDVISIKASTLYSCLLVLVLYTLGYLINKKTHNMFI